MLLRYEKILPQIDEELNHPSTIYLKKMKLYMTQNYMLSYANGLEIIPWETIVNVRRECPSSYYHHLLVEDFFEEKHELGHVNFTDFCLLNIFYSWLTKGKFYPSEPIPESSEEELAKEESRMIIEDAKRNANAIVHEALVSATKTENERDLLKKNITVYKNRVKSLIQAQLEIAEDLDKMDIS